MKKLSFLIGLFVLVGCTKNIPLVSNQNQIDPNLSITSSVGIKLQTTFVTTEVSMNVKTQAAQTVTVKITDITNRVVSKSTSDLQSGDNILKLYTSALPSSAYRIAVYDNSGNLLAITDFNKI
jgi:hypothetical protein